MPYLVDGNSNVAEVRGQGYEDEIADVTPIIAERTAAGLPSLSKLTLVGAE